MFVAS